jgi:hypothetical protein
VIHYLRIMMLRLLNFEELIRNFPVHGNRIKL